LFLTKYIEKVTRLGVRPEYSQWEIFLTRKLNTITLMAVLNITLAFTFFLIFKAYDFALVLGIVILIAPLVWLFNKYRNYIWAAYTFYIIGFIFFIFMNLMQGRESYAAMFYFPVIISMVQLLGRKETIKHLFALSVFCLVSVICVLIGFEYKWLHYDFDSLFMMKLIYFNIILSLITALGFIVIVVSESLRQERTIKNMLAEKEILLAEVFHRVKNNMNIVTSLLNLKKNTSDSPEVQSALEDCRSRVYSMALVHHKIFNRDNIIGLNFNDYIQELVKDLLHSLGGDNVKVTINADDIRLNLATAIPCGLILNELITNSIKYAQVPGKDLCIKISVTKQNDYIELQVADNGPGIPDHAINKFNSLGLELIKSLSEQIDGAFKFSSNNGLVFDLKFKNV